MHLNRRHMMSLSAAALGASMLPARAAEQVKFATLGAMDFFAPLLARDEGLFRLAGGAFLPVAATAPIGPQIFALFQSRDGKIWAGGQNGLARFDGQKWKIFSTTTGLPSDGPSSCMPPESVSSRQARRIKSTNGT